MDLQTQTSPSPHPRSLPGDSITTLAALEKAGPLRIDELALAADIQRPALAKIVRTLVDDELVFRIADVDDAHDWLIAVAAKGARALLAQHRPNA